MWLDFGWFGSDLRFWGCVVLIVLLCYCAVLVVWVLRLMHGVDWLFWFDSVCLAIAIGLLLLCWWLNWLFCLIVVWIAM